MARFLCWTGCPHVGAFSFLRGNKFFLQGFFNFKQKHISEPLTNHSLNENTLDTLLPKPFRALSRLPTSGKASL